MRIGLAAAALLLGAPAADAAPQYGYPSYPYYYAQPRYEPPPRYLPQPRKRRIAARPKLPDAPPKDTPKPQGPLTLVVSIETQRVKVYDNNGLFAQSPISSGTASNPTPTGVFSIIQKNKYHRSNLYSNAPMPYMQRITWSGVALHEGQLPGYPASHGCIRLPREFAVKLWSWTRLGMRVVIAPGELTPVELAHPRLEAVATAAQKTAQSEVPELRLTPIGVRTAEASAAAPVVSDAKSEAPASDAATSAAERLPTAGPPMPAAIPSPRPSGHLAMFVSRKDRRVYVRQGFEPWFDMPITIEDSLAPIGTHVYSALPVAGSADALRWMALTVPDTPRPPPAPRPRRGETPKPADMPKAIPKAPAVTAAQALDRIALPDEALERIGTAWKAGASLVVSDQGLGDETGRGTDFIVVTR